MAYIIKSLLQPSWATNHDGALPVDAMVAVPLSRWALVGPRPRRDARRDVGCFGLEGTIHLSRCHLPNIVTPLCTAQLGMVRGHLTFQAGLSV